MKSYAKRYGTIFTISGMIVAIMYLVPFLGPSQQQLANALDFEPSDFNCIVAVGNIGNNICSEDNDVANIDNAHFDSLFDCTASATVDQSNSATNDQANTGEQSSDFDQSNSYSPDESNSVEQCTLISTPN
jgi:hypothetical protein